MIQHVTVANLRCRNRACGKLLARLVTAPYRFECPRCETVTEAGVDDSVAKTYTMVPIP